VSSLGADARRSFNSLSNDPSLPGFAFLASLLRSGSLADPILCVSVGEEIVGAIGPISIHLDALNRPWLLPPYFGVQADYRRAGVGSALWDCAISLAAELGAEYTLVQCQAGSPAAAFYQHRGLERVRDVWREDSTLCGRSEPD
jgi:GNAT superfamily N-acetyltransferase